MVGIVHDEPMAPFTTCEIIPLKESKVWLAVVLDNLEVVTLECACGSVTTVDEILTSNEQSSNRHQWHFDYRLTPFPSKMYGPFWTVYSSNKLSRASSAEAFVVASELPATPAKFDPSGTV